MQARIFVATAEGSCFVFQFTESGDEFRPSSEFVRTMESRGDAVVNAGRLNSCLHVSLFLVIWQRVSLNVCALAVLDGDLVVGTRDGGLYIYRADTNAVRIDSGVVSCLSLACCALL